MGFVSAIALSIAALSALVTVAHFLRRRLADTKKFAPLALVPAAQPATRTRARLEDKGLFSARVALVLLLAVVAASPFVTCSRVTLARGGASVAVAIIIDDSLSMRATYGGQKRSRFARAKEGLAELVRTLRTGDAVAVVVAGAEPRVALALTSDLGAVERTIEGLQESDRGTDLRGALGLARSLLASTPHVDKRIVLATDMADPSLEGPLDLAGDTPVTIPLRELMENAADCAIASAEKIRATLRIRVACTPGASPAGRELIVKSGAKEVGRTAAQRGDVTLPVSEDATDLVAHLSPGDALESDDHAPVAVMIQSSALGLVADVTVESETSAHSPAVEQALRALGGGVDVRPIATLPERAAEVAGMSGLLVDDPPGFTPEQRTALSQACERGLVLFLALGRRAAAPVLGATFEPFLESGVRFTNEVPTGFRTPTDLRLLPMLEGLEDLRAKGRILLPEMETRRYETLVAWQDGAPFLARRAFGRGEIWVTTLPMRADESDLPLRTGFLVLLDAFAAEVKAHTSEVGGKVGRAWRFGEGANVVVTGPRGALVAQQRDHAMAFVPDVAGTYKVTVNGIVESRTAVIQEEELAFEPKPFIGGQSAAGADTGAPRLDVTWVFALALLFAFAAELALRIYTLTREPKQHPDPRVTP